MVQNWKIIIEIEKKKMNEIKLELKFERKQTIQGMNNKKTSRNWLILLTIIKQIMKIYELCNNATVTASKSK